MKSITIATIAFLVLPATVRGAAADIREQTTRSWDGRPIGSVVAENPQGLVTVRASADGKIHLTAYKIARDGTEPELKELASKTRVEADARDGRLVIRVRYPERSVHVSFWDVMKGHGISRVEVRLALETPPSCPVVLKSASGDLETAGLVGSQQVESSSGDITIADATGPLDVSTRSGDIVLSQVAGARLTTSSGDVDVDAVSGSLRIDTGSGTVRVGKTSGPVVATSSSGDVSIGRALSAQITSGSGEIAVRSSGTVRVATASGSARIVLDPGVSRVDVSTESGDVTLRLDPALGCRVDLQSSSGSVDVGANANVESLSEGHLIATVGNGKVPVVLRSSSGNLNLVH